MSASDPPYLSRRGLSPFVWGVKKAGKLG